MIAITEVTVELREEQPLPLDSDQIITAHRKMDGSAKVLYWYDPDDEFECGAEKSGGGECEMNVDTPTQKCRHHE